MTEQELKDLNRIAEALRLAAEATNKPAQHKFSDLTLTLRHHPNGILVLSLTKPYRQASEEEREACKKAFKVPTDHSWSPDYNKGWGIIRYTWMEKKQLRFAGLDAGEGTNNWQKKFD